MSDAGNPNIVVEITDATEFHCFRLLLNPASAPGERIEVMLHARSLVDLIHKCSVALCEWQAQTSRTLIDQLAGKSAAKFLPQLCAYGSHQPAAIERPGQPTCFRCGQQIVQVGVFWLTLHEQEAAVLRR